MISDIHGCNKTFKQALKTIKLTKKDHLYLLGDLIDRGPDSKGVLDTVFLLKDSGFQVTCLMGNHELMFLESFTDIEKKIKWLKNGGKKTTESFLTTDSTLIPEKYIDFIKSFPFYIEKYDHILVHAGINMTIKKPFEDHNSMLWVRDWEKIYDKSWLKNRIIIHGHSPLKKQLISKQITSRVINIDNGCFIKNDQDYGSLCVYNITNGEFAFIKNLDQ